MPRKAAKRGNAEALATARQHDSARKREAVVAAVQTLLGEGVAVSVAEVAKRAKTSRQFVYSHPDLRLAVETAMGTQRHADVAAQRAPRQTSAAVASLRADLAVAEQELRRLRAENSQLRSDLSLDLGAQVESQDRAQVAQSLAAKTREVDRLIAENQRLQRQVAALRREVNELTDDLAAERRAQAEIDRASNVRPMRKR